jgi:MFS family permease
MKKWKGLKWCVAFLALAFLVCFGLFAYGNSKVEPYGLKRVMFSFSVMMLSGFAPLIAAIVLVLPYSIVTKRWYAFAGASAGSLLFYPAVPALTIVGGILLSLPLWAWREGMYLHVFGITIAYFALAGIIVRKWIKKKRSQPPTEPYSEPASRAPQG